MSPDGAAVGSEGVSDVCVSLVTGAPPLAPGHWNPGMPSPSAGSAGLVGVAGLEVVATAEVGTTGLPEVPCVFEGSKASEVGMLPDSVGSAIGTLVSAGKSPEAGIVGITYEPSENESTGAFVGISVGMVAYPDEMIGSVVLPVGTGTGSEMTVLCAGAPDADGAGVLLPLSW